MKYNYVIIEDNKSSLESLQLFMQDYLDYNFKGAAHDVAKGISLILNEKPQLLFLDVEIINGTGFDVLKEIRSLSPTLPFVIMTTDFDKYAKPAVNNDVLYFLDKPINPDVLVIALRKFEKSIATYQSKFSLKNSEGHFFMHPEQVLAIISDGSYSIILKSDDRSIHLAKNTKEIENILPNNFMRIHKSYIINTFFVDVLNTTYNKIVLKCKNNLNLSRKLVYDKEKIDLNEIKVKSKLIQKWYKTENFLVLPVGDTMIEKVKNILLLHQE